MTDNHPVEWLSSVHFRNPGSVAPLIIQCSMLLSSALVLVGLCYVVLLVVAITIHHVILDRDPKKVPDFVRRSIQFDSDSDSSDEEGGLDYDEKQPKKTQSSAVRRSVHHHSGKGNQEAENSVASNLQSRKAANLEKFLQKELDVNKK